MSAIPRYQYRRPQRRGIVNPVAHKTDHLAFEQSDVRSLCIGVGRKQRRTGGQRRQRVVA